LLAAERRMSGRWVCQRGCGENKELVRIFNAKTWGRSMFLQKKVVSEKIEETAIRPNPHPFP
jgi:hypothetical protein